MFYDFLLRYLLTIDISKKYFLFKKQYFVFFFSLCLFLVFLELKKLLLVY